MACLLSRSFRPPSYQLPRVCRVCPACPVLLPVHPLPACLFVLDRLAPSCPAVPQRAGPSYPAALVPSWFGPFCPDAFPLRSGHDPGPSSPDRLPLTFSLDPLQRPAHVPPQADVRAGPLAAASSFVCFVLAAHCIRQSRGQHCKLILRIFS